MTSNQKLTRKFQLTPQYNRVVVARDMDLCPGITYDITITAVEARCEIGEGFEWDGETIKNLFGDRRSVDNHKILGKCIMGPHFTPKCIIKAFQREGLI